MRSDDLRLKVICIESRRRAEAVVRCLDVLLPDAMPDKRKRVANRIFTLCDGRDRRVWITQDQARDLIFPHMQCLQRNCPELIFWEPIARSLNLFFHEEE